MSEKENVSKTHDIKVATIVLLVILIAVLVAFIIVVIVYAYGATNGSSSNNLQTSNETITTRFTVDSNENGKFNAHLDILNKTSDSIEQFLLGFTCIRSISSITGASVLSLPGANYPIGDYYLLQGDGSIPANSIKTITLQGGPTITHYTDAPAGYFMIPGTSLSTLFTGTPIAIACETILLPFSDNVEFQENEKNWNTPIEGNPVASNLTPNTTLIVPIPVTLNVKSQQFALIPSTTLYYPGGDQQALSILKWFDSYINPATGFQLKIMTNNNQMNTSSISLVKDSTMNTNDAYSLSMTNNSVIISASSPSGWFYGLESLLQLLPPNIYSRKIQNVNWIASCMDVVDYPRFGYRGVLLDSARNFQPVERVKKLLDLMAIHKLNTFHWHLTDDEGWRIQIDAYPQLTEIGAWRGYKLPLGPALDSGPNRYGGYYTKAQIRDIVQYASERFITIVPEIDTPGHARALIKSLPNLLVDPNDRSKYRSVQGYTDNVLNPAMDTTYIVLDNIFKEVAELFPGKYIHVGGDEVPPGVWIGDPLVLELMKQQGFTSVQQVQNYFSKRLQTILQYYGKDMAGWYEISQGGTLNSNTLVEAWNSQDNAITAAEGGYNVVEAIASNLYFDLAYNNNPSEPGYYWAGFVNSFSAYSFTPITSSMTDQVISRIRGIEGTLWSENIFTNDYLQYLGFPKISALAEVAWSPAKRRNWRNFAERMGHLHLPRLDFLDVYYRLPLPGIRLSNGVLYSNIEFPGLTARYELSDTIPSNTSHKYLTPVHTSSNQVTMRSFSTTGRGGLDAGVGYEENEFFYQPANQPPNLPAKTIFPRHNTHYRIR